MTSLSSHTQLSPDLRAFLQRGGRWGALVLASLLLNALLWGTLAWLSRTSSAPPPPLRVQTISPQQLEAIRKHWETERQKKLLLKAQGQTTDTPDPQARFESDRAVRVEREQRARQTDVVPSRAKPRGAATPQKSQPQQSAKREAQRPRTSSLSSLGVPLHTKPPQAQAQTPPAGAPDGNGNPGGAQSLAGEESLPEGSENLLNTQESRFYSFYSRIYEAIGPLWKAEIQQVPRNRRLAPGVYRTVAEVTLTPSGELDSVRILQSAGVVELDSVVVSSWKKIARFPNPPKPLWAERGKVIMNWSFEFQLTSGFQWVPGGSQRL